MPCLTFLAPAEKQCYIYNILTDIWRDCPEIPYGSWKPTAIGIDNKEVGLYAGAIASGVYTAHSYLLDINTGVWTATTNDYPNL